MTHYEIALFKEFLDSKAMTRPFINQYRTYPNKKNPVSIEEYLLNINASEVCMQAFYFVANSNWGYNYWLNMQHEFDKYLHDNKDNESLEEEWWHLHGKYQHLRYNWDSQKPWKKEKRLIAAQRLGIELPEYIDEKSYNKEDDSKNIQTKPVVDGAVIEFFDPTEDEKDEFLDGLQDVETTFQRQILKNDEISINLKKNGKKSDYLKGSVTFNQIISREIRERGGYEYAALRTTRDGQVVILFNDVEGSGTYDSRYKSRDGKVEKGNTIINSKTFTQQLIKLLGLDGEYFVTTVKLAKKTDDYAAYYVSKEPRRSI